LPVGLGKVKGAKIKKNKKKQSTSTTPRSQRTPRSPASINSPGTPPQKEETLGAVNIAGLNDTTSAEVRESRKILSDAAIVKIMKSKLTIFDCIYCSNGKQFTFLFLFQHCR
jgi:hypothetical protein